MPVYVKGLAEVNYLLSKADRETRLGLRKAERDVAEPVRRDAEILTQMNIPRTRLGHVQWWRMRVGVTRQLIYVAPRQRGIKGRGQDPRRRPRFANLMMHRAMEPALKANEQDIERRFEGVLDFVAARFNTVGKVVP